MLRSLYRSVRTAGLATLNRLGWNVMRTSDFYSPLPVLANLRRNRERWDRPSGMVGVDYDIEAMKTLLDGMLDGYGDEYLELPTYEEVKGLKYGPGFTLVDAEVLYLALRHLKPRRYLEIGSGFSTYYAWRALRRNADDRSPCDLVCVDPFPTGRLDDLEGLRTIRSEVQSVDLSVFEELGAGDVLFIDSTHVLKVDGDVAFLYLEVVPRLAPGVVVHVHDIAFPYNTPHPASAYVFNAKWPYYRTEAQILQAFLAYNRDYEILLSTPILRHVDDDWLAERLPDYRRLDPKDFDTHHGSLWFRRAEGGDET